MRDIRVCAVVMSSSMDKLLPMISQAEKENDLVEIRIDYLLEHNERDLHRIKEHIKKTLSSRAEEETKEENGLVQRQVDYHTYKRLMI